MARSLAVAAMLLGALPGAFAHAVSSNACSEMPYALLETYEPAKEWCSSHNQNPMPTAMASTILPTQCADRDFLCSVFSDLQKEASTIASSLCSCIATPIVTTATATTTPRALMISASATSSSMSSTSSSSSSTRSSSSSSRSSSSSSSTTTSSSRLPSSSSTRPSSSSSRPSSSSSSTMTSSSRLSSSSSARSSSSSSRSSSSSSTRSLSSSSSTAISSSRLSSNSSAMSSSSSLRSSSSSSSSRASIGTICNGTVVTTTITTTPVANTATVMITITPSASRTTITTTVTLPANITTVTTTLTLTKSASTSSTSTISTSPPGPPTCTPAASPSGTCAYLADYNSGTSPQLWGGAAASLDACALLCDGEPGCRSLAYNPSAKLQCVLFSTLTSGLTTTADSGSSTSFYDSTCFGCSGAAPRPPTDNGCTPSLQPSANSVCGQSEINAAGTIFEISAAGNTAPSTGACAQQCLAQSQCLSFSFDGTNCMLYSLSAINLELSGLLLPTNPGVQGSVPVYDNNCFVCPLLACTCPTTVSKRELVRREAGVSRREANVGRREEELSRRMVAVAERERALAGYS